MQYPGLLEVFPQAQEVLVYSISSAKKFTKPPHLLVRLVTFSVRLFIARAAFTFTVYFLLLFGESVYWA